MEPPANKGRRSCATPGCRRVARHQVQAHNVDGPHADELHLRPMPNWTRALCDLCERAVYDFVMQRTLIGVAPA